MTGDELRSWRDQHGYTQITLAQILNVHPMTVSKWETGARDIPPFLHLALEALERKGGEKKARDTAKKKKTRKEVKAHG